jgi:hypothetical protein
MTEPFDTDKSWRSLTRVAEFYFWRVVMKEETMPVADRVKRLRQLAKVLGRARDLMDKAMQDDIGTDLFRGWCAEANISPASVILGKDGSSVLTRVADEIEDVVASLDTLETAASRAVNNIHTGRGRPKGTVVLPLEYVCALADVYRTSTGLKPGAGDGPFARFAHEFLAAVGQRVLEYRSVVDVIKDARLSGECSSVFDR